MDREWDRRVMVPLLLIFAFSSTISCKALSMEHGRGQAAPVVIENAGKLSFPGWVKTVAFSDEGESLLVGGCVAADPDQTGPCGRGLIQVWRRSRPRPETLTFPKAVTALTVSPDGKGWVAGDEEGRLISSLHKNVPRPLHQKGEITTLVFSPDGKWVASGSADPSFPLGFLERVTWGVVKVKMDFDPVSALAFSPDSRELAVGTNKGEVLVWEYSTPRSEPIEVSSADKVEAVTGVAFSPDGRLLAYGTSDGKVRILERGTWQFLVRIDGRSSVRALAFSPDGRYLAVAHDNGKVLLLDSAQAFPVWTKRHILPILDLAYSPDGRSLAVAAQGTVFLYSVGGAKEERVTDLQR